MIIERLSLEDLLLLTPNRIEDSRGWSYESYSERELSQFIPVKPVCFCYHSANEKAGTLRGIHYQIPPMEQAKCVKCIRGSIYDVAVDLRPHSKTFAHWVGVELSQENQRQVYLPKGFGHAFLTLEDHTEILYLMTDYYSKEHSRTIAWDDQEIGIEWNCRNPILSDKDKNAFRLSDMMLKGDGFYEGGA